MTTLYLVRHAHSDWRPDEGRPLSVRGQASALELAAHLDRFTIAAIYSSPARRAIETIEPLSHRLRIQPVVLPDLRERDLAPVSAAEFEAAIEASWREPDRTPPAGESNAAAQARGVAVVRQIVPRHERESVLVSTHGNLLALILNGFDSAFGYDFWRTLTFPDVFELTFRDNALTKVRRVWAQPAQSPGQVDDTL